MANARVHHDVVKGTAGALRRDWCWMSWMYWMYRAYWMLVAKSLRPHIAGPRTTGASQDQASRVNQVPCDSAQGNSVCGGGWGKLGRGTGPKVLFPAALLSRQRPVYHRTWRLAQRLAGTRVLLGSSRRDNSGQDIHGRRCRGSGATATSLKETLTRQPGPLCAGAEA